MARMIPQHQCDKTCPRDCETFNRILAREAAVERIYEQLLEDCDYPDVHRFVGELLRSRREHVGKFERALNKMYSSFDPSGV